MPAEQKASLVEKSTQGSETGRLRLFFLVPLGVAILAIVLALALALFKDKQQLIEEGVLRIRASASEFYNESIRYDARALLAVMDTLKRHTELNKALKHRDRQTLLRHSATLFEDIRAHFNISHLYFSGPDRVNLLRVHSPQRHGDVIDRHTTRAAQRSGTAHYGVELGPLGTFTLRLVAPWFDKETHELIGYVELGMEIDRVLQQLRDFFGLQVFVLIHKDALDRQTWEEGMRALGRTSDWDRLPSVVVGTQTPYAIPPILSERLAKDKLTNTNVIHEARGGDASYRLVFLPLRDAEGKNVAHMVLIADVTRDMDSALSTVYVGSVTALGAGTLLFLLFYWQVGRIGHRIEQNEMDLKQLATYDALTGLHNRRTFDVLLSEEITRGRRHGYGVGLLMIDVDHFKKVNDTHGHPAGDAILRELSQRLNGGLRSIDRICRYGGEEIAIILPQPSPSSALVAERLRAKVENQPFDIGNGQRIAITVSIGAATFPPDADDPASLVAAADKALYAAKAGGRNKVCTANVENPVA